VTSVLAHISAALTAAILQAAGFAVARHGTVILHGGRAIAVVAECSGARSLIAITGVILLACLLGWIRRSHAIWLLAVGMAASVACNVARCCVTVLWPGLHDIAGYIAFATVLATVLATDAHLSLKPRKGTTP
jgi:exosortase/archaeosortase family protein